MTSVAPGFVCRAGCSPFSACRLVFFACLFCLTPKSLQQHPWAPKAPIVMSSAYQLNSTPSLDKFIQHPDFLGNEGARCTCWAQEPGLTICSHGRFGCMVSSLSTQPQNHEMVRDMRIAHLRLNIGFRTSSKLFPKDGGYCAVAWQFMFECIHQLLTCMVAGQPLVPLFA